MHVNVHKLSVNIDRRVLPYGIIIKFVHYRARVCYRDSRRRVRYNESILQEGERSCVLRSQ